MKLFRQFLYDESGATIVEYGLICCLLFLAIVASMTNMSSSAGIMYGHIVANLH